MVMSIWRKAHLWLAIIISAFLLIASVTGAILSFEPIYENSFDYILSGADDLLLVDVIQNVQSKHEDLLSLSRDRNGYLLVQTLKSSQPFYANPITGDRLGEVIKTPRIFEFSRALHRSLFLKQIGRFIIGLVSFLLILMSVSGFFLVLKKQGGLKRYLSKVIKNEFNQDYHTKLSRWLIGIILVIAVTGTYLFLERFSIIPTFTFEHEIEEALLVETPKRSIGEFPALLEKSFGELRQMAFPFAEFPDEYFEFKLKHEEILVNQFNGEIVSKVEYPVYKVLSILSFKLHTGEGTVIWTSILGLTSIAMLFFIYSGFAIYFKRDKMKISNPKSADIAKIVILYGSEQGSTLRFANALHIALLSSGKKSFITDMNNYQTFPKLEQLYVLTSTYGVGEAPVNASKFSGLFNQIKQKKLFKYAVVGFGSTAYPDYCQFAIEVDEALADTEQGEELVPLHKINNASLDSFLSWANQVSELTGIAIPLNAKDLMPKKEKHYQLEVTQKTYSLNQNDSTFTLELKNKNGILRNYESGDLLSILPEGESLERLYSMSVSRKNNTVLLSVKKHEHGVCSTQLSNLEIGERIKVSFKRNDHFHLPRDAPGAILVSNGTGMAPYLGMIADSPRAQEIIVFWGGQNRNSFKLYEQTLQKSKQENLTIHTAYSREQEHKLYVQDILEQHMDYVREALDKKYILMLCGGLSMQKSVEDVLNKHFHKKGMLRISNLKAKGLIKTDCY